MEDIHESIITLAMDKEMDLSENDVEMMYEKIMFDK